MTRDEVKNRLVQAVEHHQGGKVVEIIARLAEDLFDWHDSRSVFESDVTEILDELVEEGRLIEIEYVLPNLSYTVKSFYLPAGSTVRVVHKKRNVLVIASPKPGEPGYDPKNDPDACQADCGDPTLGEAQ
jgi:hypothetical protein